MSCPPPISNSSSSIWIKQKRQGQHSNSRSSKGESGLSLLCCSKAIAKNKSEEDKMTIISLSVQSDIRVHILLLPQQSEGRQGGRQGAALHSEDSRLLYSALLSLLSYPILSSPLRLLKTNDFVGKRGSQSSSRRQSQNSLYPLFPLSAPDNDDFDNDNDDDDDDDQK